VSKFKNVLFLFGALMVMGSICHAAGAVLNSRLVLRELLDARPYLMRRGRSSPHLKMFQGLGFM